MMTASEWKALASWVAQQNPFVALAVIFVISAILAPVITWAWEKLKKISNNR